MTIWTIWRALKRRWWLIAFCTGLVTGIVGYYYWSLPKQWEGFTTITEYRSLVSTQTLVYTDPGSLQADIITRLQNLANVLGSQTVLQRTWSELKDSGNWAPAEEIKRMYAPGRLQDNAGVMDLINRLSIMPIPNTEYIRVSLRVEGDDLETTPRQALYAIETLMRKFREHYGDINEKSAEPSFQYVQNLVDSAKRDYERAQRELVDYLERNKDVIQPDNQTQILLNNIAALEARRDTAEVDQRTAAARYTRLQQLLDQETKRQGQYRPTNEVAVFNPVLQRLLIDKATAMNELNALEATKGENHPDVKSARQRLEEIERQIEQQQEEIINSRATGINPIYDSLLKDLFYAKADLDVANARVRKLQAQVGALRSRLEGLPKRRSRYDELLLQKAIAEKRYNLYQDKLAEARAKGIQFAQPEQFIKTIDPPTALPLERRLILRLLLAFILSLVLSSSLVLFLSQLDQGVYTPMEAESLLGAPVVAALPRMRQRLLSRDHVDTNALSASYQMLSTNLLGSNGQLQGPALVIASAEPNVGRSTVAFNLAITLARDGAKVVLVDADLRQPSLHRLLRLENRAGLTEVLSGELEPEQVVQMTPVEGLVFISAGTLPDNPIRLLRSPRMQQFIDKISQVADFILFDSPAGITFADSGVTAIIAKNVLLVHAAGTPVNDATKEFLKRLQHLGINTVGVVLNKVRLDDSHGYIHFQRAYRSMLALRNGYTSVRPALTAGSEAEEPEQTSPRD